MIQRYVMIQLHIVHMLNIKKMYYQSIVCNNVVKNLTMYYQMVYNNVYKSVNMYFMLLIQLSNVIILVERIINICITIKMHA